MGRRSSYSGLNLAPLAPSSCSTASATATPPSPPFSHTSHNSTPTSSAAHSSRTAASSAEDVGVELCEVWEKGGEGDRKSTRLNSSHLGIATAVLCR